MSAPAIVTSKPSREEAHQAAVKDSYAGRLTKREDGFYIVPTSLFVSKVDLKMPTLPEIAFFSEKEGKVAPIKLAGEAFSPLALSNFDFVLVSESDLNKIQKFAEDAMVGKDDPLKPKAPVDQRMNTLRQAAIAVVEDLFQNPSPENISKSKRVVGSFVYLLMREPEAYLFLARLSSHDPYTLQHSVGAAVNSIILARKLGVKDEKELEEVGMGGLLHDVGKVKVKKEIINKEGPLDEFEWEEMRQHSSMGYDIIKGNRDLSDRTKLAVLEHHEDKSQGGYPNQIPWGDVAFFSKIVCISDIFNALTTNRSYSKAKPPFEAFQLMRDKLAHKIDDELFKQLVLIYGGKIDDLIGG